MPITPECLREHRCNGTDHGYPQAGEVSDPQESRPLFLRLRNVFLQHGWAVWTRGPVAHFRPRDGAYLPIVNPLFLVHSYLPGSGGTYYGYARRRRLLPLDSRGVRRLLGISCRVVELVRFIFAWCALCRLVHGLFGFLFSSAYGMAAFPGGAFSNRGHRLYQRARDP